MKVFKFGGASVRDAKAVRNVVYILDQYAQEQLIIVISAMGKTTNALEEIVTSCWEKDSALFKSKFEEIYNYHHSICEELEVLEMEPLQKAISSVFDTFNTYFEAETPDNYDFLYDQIVSLGEVLSTQIVAAYLQKEGRDAAWLDARKLIRTDNHYRDADVDWKKTEFLLSDAVKGKKRIYIIQGFIGHTPELMTTTLGREGSDFTAAIVAYCLNATDVSIWKDVPGMLNADPKQFDNTIKLDQISFNEALELAYYGASVIHPKTIKPLQNKGISLHVKSFNAPKETGTIIQSKTDFDTLIPSYIHKNDQTLISFTTRDFSFIIESHLSDIFQKLSHLGVKIQIMQNSALSFTAVIDSKKTNMETLLNTFSNTYKVKYNSDIQLLTIRHYNNEIIKELVGDKEILLQQFSRSTARLIIKP